MILLKELKLNNFLSHEDTQITFKENEKLLLDGKSGSGKSSITEAILWVLYGEGRSENRSLIRRGAKMATTSLKLTDGKRETFITRSVSSTGKNTLAITQNTGSKGQFLPIERTGLKDAQDWIEKEFLKASYELFTNSVAYPQENENSFVKANASRRKDLLLEIVRAGNFDELYDKTRAAINANELESTSALSKIESLETTIKNSEEIANKYDFYKKEVEDASLKIEGLVIIEKDLEKKINSVTDIMRQIEDKIMTRQALFSNLSSIQNQLGEDAREIEAHEKIDITSAKKDVEQLEMLFTEIEEIEKELIANAQAQQYINKHLSNKPNVFDYNSDIETINKRLIPLIKDTNKCPAGDKCPFIIPIKGQIDFLTEQITEKTEKEAREKLALEKWEKEYAALVPVKDTTVLYNKLGRLKDKARILSISKEIVTRYEAFGTTYENIKNRRIKLTNDLKEASGQIEVVDKTIAELKETLVKIDSNQINTELSRIRISLQQAQQNKDMASSGLTLAINAQGTIKDASTGLVELRKAVSKSLEDKESLELLKEAFSPRGVRAVIIDYLVPQLEDRINSVLSQMSDFRIRLDTQKATADEEGVKEGLFITVLNDRKEELSFSNYSGGEKVKITIAISEALASLMSQIGFRIMDENIISLDRESTEGFVTVLAKLQEKFPQLLVISHLQEVKDMFEKQIMITKINGISKIV